MTWIREVYLRGHRCHRLRLVAVSHSPYWPILELGAHAYRHVETHPDGRWICEATTDLAPELAVHLTDAHGGRGEAWVDATVPFPAELVHDGHRFQHIARGFDGLEEYRAV